MMQRLCREAHRQACRQAPRRLPARLLAAAMGLSLALWALGTPVAARAAGGDRIEGWQIRRAPAASISSDGVDDFKAALVIVLNRMMASYHQTVSAPLSIDVLDVSQPRIADFFDRVTGVADSDDVLAVSYAAQAKINGKPTAACLVEYDSTKRNSMLSGYEYSGLFSRKEILYFLAAHEFGHCMAFNEAQLGKPVTLTPEGDELFADEVAVGFFMVNGQIDTAQRIVEFNRKYVTDELHRHPDALQAYVDAFKTYLATRDPHETVKGMHDLLNLALGRTTDFHLSQR